MDALLANGSIEQDARAIMADTERRVAAGMDGCVSTPLDQRTLDVVVEA